MIFAKEWERQQSSVNANSDVTVDQQSLIAIPQTKEIREDLSEFSFAKFAATYFSSNQSHQFSSKQLKSSLLDLALPADQIAAQVYYIGYLSIL